MRTRPGSWHRSWTATGLLWLWALAAEAQVVPAGAEFVVTAYDQAGLSHSVAGDPAGGFLVVWSSAEDDEVRVRARRYAANGVAASEEFQVSTEDDARRTVVAGGGADRFLAAWIQREARDRLAARIMGRLLDARGRPTGGPFVIAPSAEENAHATLAADGSGADGFLVVWYTHPFDGSSSRVLGRRIGASGLPLGEPFQVNTSRNRQARAAGLSVASASELGFVVVWEMSEYGDGLRGRRFASSGAALGGEFRIERDQALTGDPDVAMDPSGGFVVTWEHYRTDEYPSRYQEIVARRFSSKGEPLGREFAVNTYTTDYQRSATVAMNASGEFVIAWDSSSFRSCTYICHEYCGLHDCCDGDTVCQDGPHQDGSGSGVYARAFRADGTARGGELLVPQVTLDAQVAPSLAMDGDGNLLALWAGELVDSFGNEFDVRGRTFQTRSATSLEGLQVHGGDGDGNIGPHECVSLELALHNGNLLPLTAVTASLSSETPGVTVLQADAEFGDVAVGATSETRSFVLQAGPELACGVPVRLTLRVRQGWGALKLPIELPSGGRGQPRRFSSRGTAPIPDASDRGTALPLQVSGFDDPIGEIEVALHIEHGRAGDLDLDLVAPDGTKVRLSRHMDRAGANFGADCPAGRGDTVFSDRATGLTRDARPPFRGRFRPQKRLSTLFGRSGVAVNGPWKLLATDRDRQFTGVIRCWSLNLTPATCQDAVHPCP